MSVGDQVNVNPNMAVPPKGAIHLGRWIGFGKAKDVKDTKDVKDVKDVKETKETKDTKEAKDTKDVKPEEKDEAFREGAARVCSRGLARRPVRDGLFTDAPHA